MVVPIVLSALLAVGPPAPADRDATTWTAPARGIEFARMDGGEACGRGSRTIAVIRFDPALWRIDVFHRSGTPGADSLDIDGWRRRTGAAVMFNAGQYYPGGTHMGLLVKDGDNIGSPRQPSWKGLLLAEPADGFRGPIATVADLEHETYDPLTSPYRVAVQSFMMLDHDGKKRVRRSRRLANRTAVGADRQGRILILHTEGAYALWDLADWISRSGLDIRHAMSMDGGFESQLSVSAGNVQYLSFGHWSIDESGDHSLPGARRTLPAVIGLFSRPGGGDADRR